MDMENTDLRRKKYEKEIFYNKRKKKKLKGPFKLIMSLCKICICNKIRKTFKRIMSYRLHRIPIKKLCM